MLPAGSGVDSPPHNFYVAEQCWSAAPSTPDAAAGEHYWILPGYEAKEHGAGCGASFLFHDPGNPSAPQTDHVGHEEGADERQRVTSVHGNIPNSSCPSGRGAEVDQDLVRTHALQRHSGRQVLDVWRDLILARSLARYVQHHS